MKTDVKITPELLKRMEDAGFIQWHRERWNGVAQGLTGCITRRKDSAHRVIEKFYKADDCDCSLFYDFLQERFGIPDEWEGEPH